MSEKSLTKSNALKKGVSLNFVTIDNRDPKCEPIWIKNLTNEVKNMIVSRKTEVYGSPRYYDLFAYNERTLKSYHSDLLVIDRTLGGVNTLPIPVTTLRNYLAECSRNGQAPSTITRRLAALSWAHLQLNYPDTTQDPAVKSLMRGIRRERAEKDNWKPDRVPALTLGQIISMVNRTGSSLRDTRDRAMLLVGFWGAMRESELAKICVEDLFSCDQGIAVDMGVTKTDPLGAKEFCKPLPLVATNGFKYCPVTALRQWMSMANITNGYVFRGLQRTTKMIDGVKQSVTTVSGFKTKKDELGLSIQVPVKISHGSVNGMIKRLVQAAGIKQAEKYSGHSLRAGFVTSLKTVVDDERITWQTGHTDVSMLKVYNRPQDAFNNSPVYDLISLFEEAVGG